MTAPLRLRRLALAWLALLLVCGAGWYTRPDTWRPHTQSELLTHTVFAYRQWQSTGFYLDQGDRFTLTARGEWLYSPLVGRHGPAGGRPAPAFYPLPNVAGGALIGRVGEDGQPFYVGRWSTHSASAPGLLYLRINDDLLGDNEGQLAVEIEIMPSSESQ